MIKKSFHLKFRYFVTLVTMVFMFGMEGYSQTIGTPVVSGTPVCAGSTITVNFLVTNGKGQENVNGNGVGGGAEKYFTTSTSYTLELYLNNNVIQEASVTFTSSVAPAATGGASVTIVKDFAIPSNMSFNNQYQVKISSVNPSPTGNTANHTSLPFEVHALITNNSIFGSQSGCNPFASQTLSGSQPAGGNNTYKYLWETSTTSASTGFSPAPGINNGQDYEPVTLSQTTWFRRIVTSGACTNPSNVIEISITNDNTWTGNIDSDWNTPGNWSCNAIPIPVTNVIIPAVTNLPVINTGVAGTANNIIIEPGAQLTISTNTLELGESISNNGIFDVQNGSLNFVGITAQNIPTGSLLNNRVANLTVNNPAGLILNGPVEVTGTVLAETGELNSNGNLKLISDATRTALIDGAGAGQVIGDVIMQRYLDVAHGYKYISTPFNNTTVGNFSAFMDLMDPVTKFPHFYGYDESRQSNGSDASGWVMDTVSTSTLTPGRGYAVNFGNTASSKLVELSGEVNNDQINLTLPNSNGIYTKGFHLLGNPYPSPIDWTLVTHTNVEDALYFYTAGSTDQYTGTYSSFVNGVSSGVQETSSIIPSMQGFFVKVSDGTTGAVSFQNSARVNDFSQAFLKKPKSLKSEIPLIRLHAGFESNEKDALVIYFPKNGKLQFEEDKDAQKLFNTDPNVPNFYSILSNNQKLSINAVPFTEERIPLGINAEKSGQMDISLQSVQNLAPGKFIYLLDKEDGRVTNLIEKESYRFKIKQGEHNDRFQLFFSKERLIDEEVTAEFPLSVFTQNNNLIADVNLELNKEGFIQVSNLKGQVLKRRPVKGEQRVKFDDLSTSGVYVMTLFTERKRFTKKIILILE